MDRDFNIRLLEIPNRHEEPVDVVYCCDDRSLPQDVCFNLIFTGSQNSSDISSEVISLKSGRPAISGQGILCCIISEAIELSEGKLSIKQLSSPKNLRGRLTR